MADSPNGLKSPFWVVAIGASAGGLEAVQPLLARLRPSGRVAYLFAQHLPRAGGDHLTEILGRDCALRAQGIADGDRLRPDLVYVVPPGHHVEVREGSLRLTQPEDRGGVAPSIDCLFRSLALDCGPRAVGVLLSGCGHDGTAGAAAIRAAGGRVLIQRPETARQQGMLQSAWEAGSVDESLAPEALADWLNALGVEPLPAATAASAPGGIDDQTFTALLALANAAGRTDFGSYKEATLRRQIRRRMTALGIGATADYVAHVQADPDEQALLARHLTVSVSAFFRDPEVFRALRGALAERIAAAPAGGPIRIWVPGCAGGEEVYSIAAILADLLGERLTDYGVQVFGTDLDTQAIVTARAGLYPLDRLEGLDPALRERFLPEQRDLVRVSKTLRECCLFAQHDLLRQPPFSHLDLVSCRNVLIYLDTAAQATILAKFHQGLEPGGLLLLGKAESGDAARGLFEPLDPIARLYRRRDVPTPVLRHPSWHDTGAGPTPAGARDVAYSRADAESALRELLLRHCTPPTVLVGERLQVVHLHGPVQRYLDLPEGLLDVSVVALSRPPLRDEVRTVARLALLPGAGEVHGHPTPLEIAAEWVQVQVVARRIEAGPAGRGAVLALRFEERPGPVSDRQTPRDAHDPTELEALRLELAATRAHLHAVVSELESSNADSQALNEELQVSSEELQSTNEELQAGNEELSTLNDELQVKGNELGRLNDILNSIQNSIQLALVVVDEDYRVRRFNTLALRIFGLLPTDLGQSLARVPATLDLPGLRAQVESVIARREPLMRRVGEGERHYLMQIAPHHDAAGRCLGAILSFADISELAQAETARDEAERRMALALDAAHAGAWEWDLATNRNYWSDSLWPLYGLDKEVGSGPSYDAWAASVHPADRARVAAAIGEAAAAGDEFEQEWRVALPSAEPERWLLARGRPLPGPDGRPARYLGIVMDITERKRTQAALDESKEQLQLFIRYAPAALAMFDREMRYLAASSRWLEDYGLGDQEVIGRSHYAVFPEITDEWRAVHRRGLAGEVVIAEEDRFERTDGTVQWLRWAVRPWHGADGAVGGIVIFSEEITARKQAELALAASRAKLAAALASMTDAVFITDATGRFVEFNDAFATFLRFRDRSECLASFTDYPAILDVYGNDGTPAPLEQWATPRALRGEVVTNAIYTLRRKDTGETWIGSYSFAPIRDADGTIVGSVVVGRDITEQRRVEQDLLASGERYRVLAETMLQGVVHQAADGTIIAMNPAAERILGKTREQILGSSSVQEEHDCIRPDGSPFPGLEHPAMVALRTGELVRGVVMGVFNPRLGDYRWIRIDAVPLRRADEPHPSEVYTIFEDITEWRQVQEVLRASEARHRALVEATFDWLWEVDEHAVYTYSSGKVQDLLGYRPEELIGRSPFDLMPPDEARRVGEVFAAIAERREPFRHLENLNLHKDGRPRLLESSGEPIFDADGTWRGYRGFDRDQTEVIAARQVLEQHQHELEDQVAERTAALTASEERLRLIMDSSADGIIGVDTGGAVTFTNATAESLLGYGPGDLLGRDLFALVGRRGDAESEPPAGTWPIHQAIHTGHTTRVDSDRFRRADGTDLDVTFSVRPKRRDGSIVGAVVVFSDATLRREAEQAREQARIAAERLARLKSEFLANMSHEIRSPLNGVLGMAQVGYRASGAQPRLHEHFARILTSGKVLLSVVNDILDFSKLEAGKLAIERLPLDPGLVVDQVVDSLGDAPAHKGLPVRVRKSRRLPAACLGDPVRLTQVLINLLGNAIKFTDHGQVTLDVAWTQGWLVLRITDTGIGMDAEQMARLFQPFEQAESGTTRRFGGTGLGLTITHRLVEMMGGRLRVWSAPGTGTRFRVALPAPAIAAVPPVPDRPVLAGTRRLAGLRLLVAEDNDVNRAVLEALLSDEGAAVTLVENGRQALEAVERDGAGWDLVLMDVQMPEMDGLEATRRILERAPDLPIVGQTAHALAEELEKCRAAGMVDRVAKPIDHEALVAAVLRHARRGGSAPVGAVPVNPADTPADSPVDIPADLPAIAESAAGLVDWAALHARYAHNPAFIDRILALALKGNQERPAQLRQWAADGELTEIGRAAHTLKGAAGNLMAHGLAELAGRTQLAVQGGSPEAPALALQLAERLEQFLAELATRGP